MGGERVLVETLYNFQEIFITIAVVMAAAITYHFMPDRVWHKIRTMLRPKGGRPELVGPIDPMRYPLGSSLYPEHVTAAGEELVA